MLARYTVARNIPIHFRRTGFNLFCDSVKRLKTKASAMLAAEPTYSSVNAIRTRRLCVFDSTVAVGAATMAIALPTANGRNARIRDAPTLMSVCRMKMINTASVRPVPSAALETRARRCKDTPPPGVGAMMDGESVLDIFGMGC
eukprot:IDg6225t1